MLSLQRKFGLNLIWNTVNMWGGTVLMLGTTVLYARLLQPSEYGVYTTFTWLVTNFALLVTLGWNLTINKFVAEEIGRSKPERAAQVFQTIFVTLLLGYTLLAAIVIPFTPTIAGALERAEIVRAMPLVLLGVIAMVLYTSCNITLIALQRYKGMSLTLLVTSTITLASGTVWLLNGGSSYGLIAITAIANTVNAAVSLLLITRQLPIWHWYRPDLATFKALARYSLDSTMMLLLIQIVYERAEIFFLSRSRSADEVGYYSLAVAMSNIAINTIPNVVIGPLLAMTAELHGRDDKAGLRQLFDSATRLLVFIAPPVGIGGALVALPLLTTLFGESYRPVGIAAMLLLPPGALMVVAKPASSLLWGMGKQSRMLGVMVGGAILNLTLDALVIPTYGVYGAAIASGFAQILTTFGTTAVCLRYLNYAFPWSRFIRAILAALLMVPLGLLPMLMGVQGIPLVLLQIAIGGVTYPLGLWLLRLIEPEDVSLLGRIQQRLPGPLQSPFGVLLSKLVRQPHT